MTPQLLRLAVRVVIFLTGCSVANGTFAQTPPKTPQPKPLAFTEAADVPQPIKLEEADAKVDAQKFVIGDWYKLRVKRRGVSAQIDGGLVKLNDQWIVLRKVSEGRNEFAVPVVSKVPFVGKRLFKNVGIGRMDDMIWIPREAATIEQRTTFAQQQAAGDGVVPVAAKEDVALLAPIGEEPPTGRICRLQIARPDSEANQAGNQRSGDEECSGDVVAVTDDVVSLMITRTVAEAVRVPLVGELPIVGRAFTRVRTVSRQEQRKIDRADILCLRVTNHQPATASVELVPMPAELEAPVAPSPPVAPSLPVVPAPPMSR